MLGQVFRNATDQEELKLEIGFQVHAYKAILFTVNSLCLFFTRTTKLLETPGSNVLETLEN